MTQKSIVVSTTPPLPGLSLVNQVNDALEALGTNFAGPGDPAAFAKPYMTWADTGNMLLKRRSAANSDWVTLGPLLTEMAIKTGDAAQTFKAAPSTAADQVIVQSQAFGVGQAWQNVLASRATNINYPNSTGKTILVAVSVTSMSVSGHGVYGQIIGIGTVVAGRSGAGGNTGSFILEVPEGSTYSITADSGVLLFWWEYR